VSEVTALTILDDVEQSMTAAIKAIDEDLLEFLHEDGAYLVSWRDDIRTAMKLLGENL
jgi:hypothetical protein